MTDQAVEETVRYTLTDGAAHIVMTRPAQLNAMTPEMVIDLRAAVARARSEGARVLLVSAEGRAFCAGRDIAGAEPGAEDGGQVLAEIFNPLMQEVADLPFPTIAA
ncbi:MAG TPA: enoyl-CoA hydratase-related protein, partial [Dermatophilaceae bacterium]|nr:enoyl-CoA hydratase-related protein [Dermatophilaceae bacterium]